MAERNFSVLILAAGKATRFKSELPKVLHRLAGRPLGEYVLRAAQAAKPHSVYMVVGHEAEQVSLEFAQPGLTFIEQKQQLGTGHALVVAKHEIEKCPSAALIVLVGDVPLLRASTLAALVDAHAEAGATATILSTLAEDPTGYGRIIRHSGKGRAGGSVEAIVEEKVATPEQRKINEISSGIICFSRADLLAHLGELSADNVQKEYLLTDLIGIFIQHQKKVAAFQAEDSREVLGVNDRLDLARIEKVMRLEKAESLARDGVTIVDPGNTYIDDEVEVGRDTTIEPGVSLLGLTRVGSGCLLRPYSTITDSILGDRVTVRPCCVITESQIASDVLVGPFAHLRDGAVVEPEARIGNFVEVKKSRIGAGSKASHLTYLGDASIGERVNIGAGTVTCNYDGEKKHPTTIESGAFIGSGSMLVAPVRIGQGSLVAAGSTITQDVPPESLALGRAQQVTKEGWVRTHRGGQRAARFETRQIGTVAIVDVAGRLTMGDPVNDLGRTIEQLVVKGNKQVVVNLGRVEYIDSSGMGVLVQGITRLRAAKGELKLSNVPQQVMYLLQVGNLDRAFEIFPHDTEAVESFKTASA
jgi:bifunctional UDP-N-acetylglucosamine pyrophosphorylase / glucosamine-1-phosphate N-acetyltransferase